MSIETMDEIFHRLAPCGTLADALERLLSDLVRRLDLSHAEADLAGKRRLTVRRPGRVLATGWSPPAGPGPPRLPSVDDAVHDAEWFESPEPETLVRPRDEGVELPLAFGARPLGELRLVWRTDRERRRNAPSWLAVLARHSSFLIHRHLVRDWSEQHLGHPLRLVGMSRAMRHLDSLMEHAAASDLPVLLGGEFGTEKLPLAVAIHCGSKRREGPFVQIDCGQAPAEVERWFDQAEGGTLFLNAVDQLPAPLQQRLPLHMRSRLGQWSEANPAPDTRIVASATLNLHDLAARGAFSRVLAVELDMLPVAAPPLRERPEDIGALIGAALERHGFRAEAKQSEALAAACRAHHWPENVCELERVIARLAVMSGDRRIERDDILRHAPWIIPDAPPRPVQPAPSAPIGATPGESELWLRCAVHRDAAELERMHEGLARALIYLGDHYPEPISLARLARHAHVSTSHISFLFRTVLNMPFKSVLARIRVHKAREILASDSRRQITDVALSVGFADLSHFEKSFKRLVGQSPREFRRDHAMRQAAE